MISIKTKKKVISSSLDNSPRHIPSSYDAKVIDGGLELIDILYQYISNDSAGLLQLENNVLLLEEQNSFLDRQIEQLSNLDIAAYSVKEVIHCFSEETKNQEHFMKDFCRTLIDITETTNSMLAECNLFNENLLYVNASIFQLKKLISTLKEQAEPTNTEIQSTIHAMDLEVKKLEACVAIVSVKSDNYKLQLNKICKETCLYYNNTLSYDEKIEIANSRISFILNKLNEVNNSIEEVAAAKQNIDTLKAHNTVAMDHTQIQQGQNSILLNDLISFLIQLKSILNYLKKGV